MIKNKNQQLEWVHYTKPKFLHNEVTIFGAKEDGLTYNYMDRLYEWDKEKYKLAEQHATQHASLDTATWYEKVISFYFDKQVDVRHIVASVGTNGYSYYAVGYKE